MTTMIAKTFEKAFDRFMPIAKVPEKSTIDYGVPSVCPYCKANMDKSKVRKANGEIETVYICRDDRAVGCMPDADSQTHVVGYEGDGNPLYK